jgi:hypothetical protein
MKMMEAPKKYASSTETDLELSWRDSSSGLQGDNNTVTATVSGEQSLRKAPEKIIKIHVADNLSHGGARVMSGSQLDGEESKSVSPIEPVSPLRGK